MQRPKARCHLQSMLPGMGSREPPKKMPLGLLFLPQNMPTAPNILGEGIGSSSTRSMSLRDLSCSAKASKVNSWQLFPPDPKSEMMTTFPSLIFLSLMYVSVVPAEVVSSISESLSLVRVSVRVRVGVRGRARVVVRVSVVVRVRVMVMVRVRVRVRIRVLG